MSAEESEEGGREGRGFRDEEEEEEVDARAQLPRSLGLPTRRRDAPLSGRPLAPILHHSPDLPLTSYPSLFVRKQDFKSAATGVSAKAMRNELNAMIQGIDDPDFKKVRRGRPALFPSLVESLESRD